MGEFNIKVISGKNLVLVESCIYGAEIFKPEIIDGIIHLNNVIQHRKRTKNSNVLVDSDKKIKVLEVKKIRSPLVPKQIFGSFNKTTDSTPKGPVLSPQSSLTSSGYYSSNSSDTPPAIRDCLKIPTKHSTPVLLPNILSEQSFTPPGNSFLPNRKKQQKNTLAPSFDYPTPSPILSQNIIKPKIIPISSLGRNLKIIKLYRNPIDGSQNNIAKIVPFSNTPKKNNVTFATPSKSARKSVPPTPSTVTKWRKCLTPAKTYSRRANLQRRQVTEKANTSIYIPKPTIGIAGSAELKVKNIRTAIDGRIEIGPKEFKQQLRSSDDLKNTETLHVRTKEQYYHAKFSSFDLLVKPIRKKNISKELHQLFTKKCTQKSGEIDRRYRQLLDDIPPLDYIPPIKKRCIL